MSTWSDKNRIFLNLQTVELLSIAAYGEAANQGTDGLMAVINVIRNRTLSNQFIDSEIYSLTGDIYKAVILKPCQFSMFNDGHSS